MNGHHGALPPNPEISRLNPPTSYPQPQGGRTFAFRKRWGQIDWRKLASVDVDRIAKEMDFQVLQQNIMNITFCNIETEEFQQVDPSFIKVFRLSQLIIEYLLHSQQYLSNQSTSLQQKLLLVHQELDKAVNDMKSREDELKAIKKENRKRRKVIEAYQDMINAGATGLHTCPVCKREFVSNEYLHSHIHRRHPDHLPKSELVDGAKSDQKPVTQEDLEAKLMEQMTERLLISEKQLREEMKQKEQETISLQVKEFESWKEKEKERMTVEFKKPILAELEELQQEKAQLEKTLREREVELLQVQSKRQSHLGHLDGAKELIIDEANQLNESKAEVKHLKETLETQLQEMQTALKKQDRSWQKRMQKLSSSYREQLTESVAKLEALEHSFLEGSQNEADKKISKKLKSLQQKLKQQEELLLSQQNQITILQSREPSPVPASPIGQDKDDLTSSDNDDDHADFYEDKKFTPFKHRPMIKTKYAHNPEDIEKIRRQTQAIFSDTLVQKGLSRDVSGLKNRVFEEKMSMLHQERQEKIKTHYHFAEHRQQVACAIDKVATDYKPVPSSPKQKSSGISTSATPTTALGKPPKPTPNVSSSKRGGQLERNNTNADNMPNEPVNYDKSDDSASTGSLEESVSLEDESDSSRSVKQHNANDQPRSENMPVVVVTTASFHTKPSPHGRHLGKETQDQPAARKTEESKVENSWDSDDSIEEMFAPHSGRISSTPVKVLSKNTAKSDDVVRPVEDISVDSYDLSSSDPVPAPLPSKVDPLTSVNKLGKHQSRTVTSQSALTSVSVEDFDSDLSELDISNIT